MTLVSSHYVHLLVRREFREGEFGWLAPYELDSDDPSGAGLAIPVGADGVPFPEYWIQVATLEGGKWTLIDQAFEFKFTEPGFFALETPSGDVRFREAEPPKDQPRALPYVGRLLHDDLNHHRLVEVVPIEDDVFDLLLNREKVFLVGCSPFEQYRDADGNRLT
jgi:hypothetical protein